MRTRSIFSRWRTAALAVAAVLTVGGCESSPTVAESRLVGQWEASTEHSPQLRASEHLHLGADGKYVWTSQTYGQGGRPGDELIATHTIVGDWEVRLDRLALRMVSGYGSRYGFGDYTVEFVVDWNTQRKVRMENSDQLSLTYFPTPIESITQYTTVFVRTYDNLR